MLYPREDREAGTLAFQCRHCNYMEDVGPTCIYRNELSYTVGETSGVTQDVASDPTVGIHLNFTLERPLTLGSSCHMLISNAQPRAAEATMLSSSRVSREQPRPEWYVESTWTTDYRLTLVLETFLRLQ